MRKHLDRSSVEPANGVHLASTVLVLILCLVLSVMSILFLSFAGSLEHYVLRLAAWYSLLIFGSVAVCLIVRSHDELQALLRQTADQSVKIERLTRQVGDLKLGETALSNQPHFVVVNSIGKTEYVPTTSIIWIGSARNYVELNCADKTVLHRKALRAVLSELPEHQFVRIHRTKLVNLAHIRSLRRNGGEGRTVLMSDGAELPIGPTYYGALLERLCPHQYQC